MGALISFFKFLQRQPAQQKERSESESHCPDHNELERVSITRILATGIVTGLRRMPAGFYVTVEVDGKTTVTSTKSARLGEDKAEWDEEITLPLERSSAVSFRVYASFELGPRLGNGELLGQFEITVGEVLDGSELCPRAIPLVSSDDDVLLSRPSLRILAKRRMCNVSKSVPSHDFAETDTTNELTQLINAGHHAFVCYRWRQDQRDLDEAIAYFERSRDLCPPNYTHRSSVLFDLATAMFIRCRANDPYPDLDVPITLYQDALLLRPEGHPDHCTTALDLSFALLARFQRRGDDGDRTRAKDLVCRVLEHSPVESYTYRAACVGLQTTKIPLPAHTLVPGVSQRDGAEVSDGEQIRRLWAELPDMSYGDPRRLVVLAGLGGLLYHRFERLGNLEDIKRSISMYEEAVHLIPEGHPDKPAYLNNLGNSLLSRFERLGNLEDIHKSISMCEEAVRLTPDRHPDKSVRLNNLGNSLCRHFEQHGNLENINKSISVLEEAVYLTPKGHPNEPGCLNNLGTSLSHRFGWLGNLEDIHKSILVFEEAVHLIPDRHPDKPARLNNLGNSLSRRFERLSNPEDINKSISMFEKAVHLTPDGHPDKPGWLNNLGNSLSRRFEQASDLKDINKSISVLEEAVRLTPDGHLNKPEWLNNLGKSLFRRFERLSNPEDIHKSISIFNEVVRLTPAGHPEKPGRLTNLGTSHIVRFMRFADPSDLSAATSHFSMAARTPTGPISGRFYAARRWTLCAHLEASSNALLDAYTTSISLIPELAWLGLPLAERHRLLRDAANTARDAAATAVEVGFPRMAVEWLEQGRSVVWGQFLQLRTPVDELHAEHPALADQFQNISRELERAGSHENPALHKPLDGLDASTLSLEKQTQRHHDLAISREKLLTQIRSLPGFDRFLLPKTAQQLAALAHSGPVVYLNASKQRCDAFVVMQNLWDVLHVPLPDMSYPLVEEMHKLLRLLLKRNQLIISRDDIPALLFSKDSELDGIEHNDRAAKTKPQRTEGYTPDELFRFVLGRLWEKVVKPVLDALGFSTPPSDGETLTRIFWCPTGPFAFLPIHAAGIYHSTKPGTKLSDFVISSYTPTLSALAPSPRTTSSRIRLVAIPQPLTDGLTHLGSVKDEIDHIRALSTNSPFVTFQESLGTVEAVLEKMEGSTSDWVHFACHGVQDPDNPLDSGLCLADSRRLKLSDIVRLSRPRGGLAFLSACQTAQGDEELSEESVHLAAGVLLAGYGGVIATMWAIMDRDAPRVSKDVYGHLFRDGKVPDSTEAAEALHYAVKHLRDSGASFLSWVPFIHVGI